MMQYAKNISLFAASQLLLYKLKLEDKRAHMRALAHPNQAVFRINAVQTALADKVAFGIREWRVEWGGLEVRRGLNHAERSSPVMPGFETLDAAVGAYFAKV